MKFASSSEFINWHYQLNGKLHPLSIQSPLTPDYFRRTLTKLNEADSRRDLLVTDVFHSLVGATLAGGLSEEEKVNAENFVNECWIGTGFSPIPAHSPSAALLRSQGQPEDIYSTYYCLGILLLAERDLPSEHRDVIIDRLPSYCQTSGWIYNADWSETALEKRFDIELCQQALSAIRIAILLDLPPTQLPNHGERLEQLRNYLVAPRYVTASYHTILCLMLLDSWNDIRPVIEKEAVEVLLRHFDSSEGGFREYLLESAKTFRYKGMSDEAAATAMHRFQSDHLTAAINATSYILWMGLYGFGDALVSALRERKSEIARFYESQQQADDGGFGTIVKIAKYQAPFGPITTPLETLSYLLGLSLLPSITGNFPA